MKQKKRRASKFRWSISTKSGRSTHGKNDSGKIPEKDAENRKYNAKLRGKEAWKYVFSVFSDFCDYFEAPTTPTPECRSEVLKETGKVASRPFLSLLQKFRYLFPSHLISQIPYLFLSIRFYPFYLSKQPLFYSPAASTTNAKLLKWCWQIWSFFHQITYPNF